MKSIIVGTTDLANQLYFHIKKHNAADVVAFAVNRDYIQNDTFLDLPVVELETLEQCYPPNEYNIYIAIGYKQMNLVRQRIYEFLNDKGYEFPNFIHPSVITDYESIGEANIILANTAIDCFSKVGNGNIFFQSSVIGHNCVVGNFNLISANVCICGHAQVGNNCFIGASSTVKNTAIVRDKTLIGAGIYISKNSKVEQVFVSPKCLSLDRSSLDVMAITKLG